jgi:hypothetical protein
MGQCEVPCTSTCGEAQPRYVVGSRRLLLSIFSGMIPGGQDKLEQEFLGRRLCGSWVQLRIDSRQSWVHVRRGSHGHSITALIIGGRIAHDPQHIIERQSTTCGSCGAGLLSCAIATALLSSTSFAAACHQSNDLVWITRGGGTAYFSSEVLLRARPTRQFFRRLQLLIRCTTLPPFPMKDRQEPDSRCPWSRDRRGE